VLLDAYLVRFRGPGWGKQKTQQARIEWHEEKLGVFYAQEQSVGSSGGELLDKVVVGWQGEPLEVGRRLHWEAMRHGLGRAASTLAVADGAPWIWSVVNDRWSHAHQLLDFYHASQHLWTLGEALHPKDEATRRPMGWKASCTVAPRKTKTGAAADGRVTAPRRGAGQSDPARANYFSEHARRMNYQTLADRAGPLAAEPWNQPAANGSAAENVPASFGLPLVWRHLGALEEARDNGTGMNYGSPPDRWYCPVAPGVRLN